MGVVSKWAVQKDTYTKFFGNVLHIVGGNPFSHGRKVFFTIFIDVLNPFTKMDFSDIFY